MDIFFSLFFPAGTANAPKNVIKNNDFYRTHSLYLFQLHLWHAGGILCAFTLTGILLRNNPAKKQAFNVITGADIVPETCTPVPLFLIPSSAKYPE